jgi:hypothetical protein
VCLQNCCKLRFLTALEVINITQCSGEKTDSHVERDNSNKTELHNFLADKIVKMCANTSNTVIVTQENDVVCNHSISL